MCDSCGDVEPTPKMETKDATIGTCGEINYFFWNCPFCENTQIGLFDDCSRCGARMYAVAERPKPKKSRFPDWKGTTMDKKVLEMAENPPPVSTRKERMTEGMKKLGFLDKDGNPVECSHEPTYCDCHDCPRCCS